MVLPIRRHGSSPGAVLRGRDPFTEFESMWDQMGRYLEQAAAPAAGGGVWLPMAEEAESGDSYTVKLELPGYPADSIDIEVEGEELIVSGELSEEHHGKVLSNRRAAFMYRTSLPTGADPERCDADLTDGVLTLTIPKTSRQQRHKIEIGHKEQRTEGKTPGELGGESGMTPVEAHNTFVAGATARAEEEQAGRAAGGTPGTATPGEPESGL
ncbi:Hsp20/alpha crystallin family protein [Streptomyces sp. NPDC046866]|uniref:Hsp20/alpha crystallin family protein n=1 Tax=Streptomyces sp. NPDC046866 TaxID=3154921 RepID=UPI0034573088